MDSKNINVNKDFTKSSEIFIENRINPYNLNDNEKTSIWKIVKERDDLVQQEKGNQDKSFDTDLKKEYEALRGQGKPALEYNMGSRMDSDANLRMKAWSNLKNKNSVALDNIQKNSDKEIDKILENARNQDRESGVDLKRDFNKAHDHER